MRTILVTLTAAVRRQSAQPQQPVGHVRDQSGQHGGGAGSLLRLLVLALIMVPITAAVPGP
ncbi:hypothetical protein MAHJHV33_48750 [Mycobacterium avium subsp. hominissuis]